MTSTAPTTPRPAEGRFWMRYAIAFALVLAAITWAFSGRAPIPPAHANDLRDERAHLARNIALIDARGTQVLILGNSIVYEGIDDERVALVSGLRTTAISREASTSAWWYLCLSALTDRLSKPPKIVVIPFRDRVFSQPSWRMQHGRYRSYLQALGGFDDPLVRALSLEPERDWRDRALAPALPLHAHNPASRDTLHGLARAGAAILLGKSAAEIAGQVQRALSPPHLSERLFTDYQLDFEANLDDAAGSNALTFDPQATYLPTMIAAARERGIRLVLVRIKRLRDARGEPRPPELLAYNRALDAYLAKQGVALLDATDEPALSPEHYAVGDHLSRGEGRRLFSDLVGRAIGRLHGAGELQAVTKPYPRDTR